MIVSDILSRARILLNDTDPASYRWEDDELIMWVNDGERLICVFRPDANPVDQSITLVAGTKQALPTNGFRLLDVIRNLGSDGQTPGRAITITGRDVLDAFNPNWHKATKTNEVRHFVYDPRNPLVFYVYPPVNTGVKIESLIAEYPVPVTTTDAELTISDIYSEPLFNYVMFRAYSKDAEFSSNSQLASGYLSVFNAIMGVKIQKDTAFSPAVNRAGGAPNAAAIQSGGV